MLPLSAPSPALVDVSLPRAELPPPPSIHPESKSLLDVGGEDRGTVSQLSAAQASGHFALGNLDDRETLVFGLGLRKFDSSHREVSLDAIELVLRSLRETMVGILGR